jgi:hypothetical protein
MIEVTVGEHDRGRPTIIAEARLGSTDNHVRRAPNSGIDEYPSTVTDVRRTELHYVDDSESTVGNICGDFHYVVIFQTGQRRALTHVYLLNHGICSRLRWSRRNQSSTTIESSTTSQTLRQGDPHGALIVLMSKASLIPPQSITALKFVRAIVYASNQIRACNLQHHARNLFTVRLARTKCSCVAHCV